MTRNYLIALLGFLLINRSNAQEIIIQQEFFWTTESYLAPDSSKWQVPVMDQGSYDAEYGIPFWSKKIALGDGENLSIKGSGFWMYADVTDPAEINYLKKNARFAAGAETVSISYATERKKRSGFIRVPGIIKETDGTFKKLEFLTLSVEKNISKEPQVQAKNGFTWKTESVLSKGKWAKIYVDKDGVYSLSYDYLTNLGFQVNSIDATRIRVYSHPAGMLPEANTKTRWDDLEELAIKVTDNNNNGVFDQGDFVLFYGQKPNITEYDKVTGTFQQRMHLYSNVKAYFVTVGDPGGKRIHTQSSTNKAATYITSSFDEVIHHELEMVNVIKSGKYWFGEAFDRETEYQFTENLPGQVNGEDIVFRMNSVARSENISIMRALINGQTIMNQSLGAVSFEPNSSFISVPVTQNTTFKASSPFSLTLRYIKPNSTSKAWLNFYTLNYRRELSVSSQIVFRDQKGIGAGKVTQFNLQTPNAEVWEVSDPLNVSQFVLNGSSFTVESDSLREFAAFTAGNYLQPFGQETVDNQNLHGLSNIDYVIVANPLFTTEANRLADFHRSHNNLNVLVITPAKIYNEFSGGIADISSIRNFMRMLYDKASPGSEPSYLLLFGDASYDYKDIKPKNTNFVPTFESENSDSPVGSYCTDDFFGLLDNDEGANSLSGSLDIGIGRLPVQTVLEATQMVDKIIFYHDVSGQGEWRNNVVFVADDQDGNTHMDHAEAYANSVDNQAPVYNVRKLYADAYKQVTVGNGQRYPEVVDEINRSFNEGSLIVNYSGHGGETQLGDERYVDIPQIKAWKGGNKLPLFVTATCEFTRFDDPERQSAGELVQLNPTGGSIGLYTTVRLVYAYPNKLLNINLYQNNVFNTSPNSIPALGDVFRDMKNATNTNLINTRSFAFIGDPAVKLAYPKHDVFTTSVVMDPGAQLADTLKALSKVTITGEVREKGGPLLSNFNGKVYVTVFGSKQNVKTLANDPGESSVASFTTYKSIIYKGTATVQNGQFTVNFIMPRDLPLEVGIGKISYYAANGVEDANGYEFIHMSPEIDVNAVADYAGPSIKLFMNDTNFVFGGLTDQDPYIYAVVYDESGINTTGIGIGRNITGLVDNNSKNQLNLNSYYTAATDDFRQGIVNYPLKDLSEGRHTVKVKVWDVHNNSSEAYTEFIVANSVKLAVENLINYPNPFSDKTTFSFEHNQQGKNFTVEVFIYQTDGTLVTNLSANVTNAESTFSDLTWDAAGKGGSKVSPGLYLYRVVVKTADGHEVQKSERLVYMP